MDNDVKYLGALAGLIALISCQMPKVIMND